MACIVRSLTFVAAAEMNCLKWRKVISHRKQNSNGFLMAAILNPPHFAGLICWNCFDLIFIDKYVTFMLFWIDCFAKNFKFSVLFETHSPGR